MNMFQIILLVFLGTLGVAVLVFGARRTIGRPIAVMMLVVLALLKESESEPLCADTMFEARDSYGDPCAYYFEYPDECGGYDDVDFTAIQMCCGCGGGFSWDLG